RGEWIALLDSDDLWLAGKLAAQMAYLSANPHIRICQTEETWLRNGSRLNPKKYHQKPEGYCFPLLLERCLLSPSAVMIHRGLFDEVGLFDESLPACEDYDLWLRIGCRHPIGLVREPLIVKRGGHSDQLSSSVPALDRYRIRALEKLLRSGVLSEEQREQAFDVLSLKCRVYGEGCGRRGRAEEAEAVLALPRMLEMLVRPRPVCGRER
ncbi:MAG: glycosyltransferase family 2 protein, partial [Acidobacteriota bacterium]